MVCIHIKELQKVAREGSLFLPFLLTALKRQKKPTEVGSLSLLLRTAPRTAEVLVHLFPIWCSSLEE